MITEGGELIIYGEGEMRNYTTNTQPWYEVRDKITTVEFGSLITTVGDYSFNGATSLQTVNIGESVEQILANDEVNYK